MDSTNDKKLVFHKIKPLIKLMNFEEWAVHLEQYLQMNSEDEGNE